MAGSGKLFFTLEELKDWSHAGAGLNPPARLAVIGDPIAHSRSPQMHNPALEACGIAAQYVRVHVPAGRVKEALDLFVQQGFIGVNCTIPHKFEALATVSHVDPLAQRLGAVNTVWIRDGVTYGYNSDGPGFLRSVEEAFGARVKNLRVLIFGAGGGAGRAVAVQCALEKCPAIMLVNRTRSKLDGLKAELEEVSPETKVTILGEEPEALASAFEEADLIVNSTPLGMKSEDAPPFDLGYLDPRHLVYDMVYTPPGRKTPLVAHASQIGAKTCDGLALLLHQGAISFEHWFQCPAPLEAMRAGLVAA